MMKLILAVLFMIPLSFSLNFWLIHLLINLLIFSVFFNMGGFYILSFNGYFGQDLLSYYMVVLSLVICSLMILASASVYCDNFFYKFFNFMVVLLMFSLVLFFSVFNFFAFYLFFEFSIIPTLFLILGWGYQPERLQAGLYLLFYTILASLPMLVIVFYLYSVNFTLMLNFFYLFGLNSLYYFVFMNLVFFVKMPMYLVHLWLPKAHVEAPISGSMILAGVMLKLGGYGLIRVLVLFTSLFCNLSMFFGIFLIGGLLVSLICLRQSDMKSLVAYSSVAHMGLVLAGLFTFNVWGMFGSILMMVAHGLCSSGLFCLVNVCYERLGSRSLYVNKGMINLMPSLSLWWFLLCSSNMSFPPSLNLLSEISLINSLISWSSYSYMALMGLLFFAGAYSLFLYSYTQHGVYFSGVYSFIPCTFREYQVMLVHWVPLNLMFLISDSFIF
uniref:NADH-ubiquinone oxidoreductase chain 4 n=1 Tax=Gibbium aequinoctiale TaxID=1050274 RepID=A0A8J9RMF8_9COLE|nr:NADH dehydrogenase subunit 4 [Gibbium aequinoctiale]ATN40785.1 NADH dehydrogenase subunit 4 [Gibbium aequinoctiale]